jgi:hypothetical protein
VLGEQANLSDLFGGSIRSIRWNIDKDRENARRTGRRTSRLAESFRHPKLKAFLRHLATTPNRPLRARGRNYEQPRSRSATEFQGLSRRTLWPRPGSCRRARISDDDLVSNRLDRRKGFTQCGRCIAHDHCDSKLRSGGGLRAVKVALRGDIGPNPSNPACQ